MKKNTFTKLCQNIFLGADYDNEDEVFEDASSTEHDEEETPVKETRIKTAPTLEALRGRKSETENSKILNFSRTGLQYQVMITYPKEVLDSTSICDYIREGSACVVNLEGVERANAQRIADFLGGAVYAFSGEIQRISNSIFIVAPANIHINGEMVEELKSNEFVFPKIVNSFR